MEIFFFLLIAALIIIVPITITQSRRANEAWSDAAEELGLTYRRPRWFQSRRMYRSIENAQVEVDTYTQRSGESSTTYTRFRITFPSLGLGLRLKAEGFLSGITKFFGAQDINVGDGEFDKGVLVKGRDAQQVRNFLTPARRMRIRRFLQAHKGATIDDQEIKWQTRGVIRDPERIVHVVRGMVRLASHLTGDRSSDETLGKALQAQNEGRSEEALAFLRDANQSNTDQQRTASEPEEQMLEGELLYLADRREEAREVFQRALRNEPTDPELAEWAAHVTETEHVAKDEQTSADTTDEGGLDVETVCKALFGQQQMTFQISRQFEQQYAGRLVHWSGELRRVDRFSYDLVFGSGPGCKAVVTVSEIESAVYGDQNISAVVQLPEKSLEPLQKREGHPVHFQGRLKKVDALLRNIYIADAVIIESP